MRAALLALALAAGQAVAQGPEFHTLDGHGGPVMAVTVAPDGRVATASFDNAVGLWDGLSPRWFDGHRAAVNVTVFAGAETLVSGGDDFRVVAWDITTGAARDLHTHRGKVVGLAVTPDGTRVASASWDGTIALIPRDGGTARVLEGHDAGVNAVAFSADGARLYSAGVDGTLRLWDVASGRELRQIVRHGFGINEIVLGPDAAWLAYGAVDGVTRVIDPVTADALADFTLERRPILAMAFSAPASRLAVGDGEGYIMVIDTDTWRIARDFRATQAGPVWALAFSPEGDSILAAGLDPIVYAWPRATLDTYDPVAGAPKPYLADPAEMTNGERQFARKCSICHTLTPGSARRAGPSLHLLFGRKAGSLNDYSYSETLKGSDIVWSEDSIDALFDEGPDHYIPGSKMPMQRITGAGDRADLIAYLRRATAPREN